MKVNFVKTEAGKANLILLHGWGQSISMWDNVISDLEKAFTLYILDLPGFGKSQEPDDIWSLKDYADFINLFVKKNKINNPSFLAHSFSARVMGEYVQRYDFRKVVFYSGNFKCGFSFFRFINIVIIIFLKNICPILIYNLHCKYLHPKSYVNQIAINESKAKKMLEIYLKTHNLFNKINITDIALLEYKSKILFVEGDREDLLDTSLSECTKKVLKAKHFTHIENKSAFLKEVLNFLRN